MPLFKTVFDDRAILSLSGDDRLLFLQGILTQDTARLVADGATYSALLTPQGKLIADFFLVVVADKILLDCPQSMVEVLFKKLRLYRLRAKVDIKDISGNWISGVFWPGVVSPNDTTTDEYVLYADPRHSDLGTRFVCPTDAQNQLMKLSAKDTPAEDYNRHRLHLGVPEFGHDFDTEQVFPLDLNMDALNGIDYAKGCFVGQEVASRMKRKGEIRKRIWRVSSTEGELSAGAQITSGGATIGEVTSSQGGAGLALVRLDRLKKATEPFITDTGVEVSLSPPGYLEES